MSRHYFMAIVKIRVLSGWKLSLKRQILCMVPTIQTQFSHPVCTGRSCSFLTSAAIIGVQMGEMSELGWLIGWSSRDLWADSLYSCMWCLVQSTRPSLLSKIFRGLVFAQQPKFPYAEFFLKPFSSGGDETDGRIWFSIFRAKQS
jgi:hypothetical protein